MNLLVILLPALFCLMVLEAAGYIVSTHTQSIQAAPKPISLETEANVETEALNQDLEKRQQELNRVVEEERLTFSTNATPFMKNGAPTTNLPMGNPLGNGKRFTITIQRNDAGEVICQSGYLDPEQHIDDVLLDVGLPKGEYSCTAYFDAYRINDGTYIRRAEAKITLYVLGQTSVKVEKQSRNSISRNNRKRQRRVQKLQGEEAEMIEGTEIEGSREDRSNHREIFGNNSRKRRFRVMAFILLAICCTTGAAADVCLSRQRAAPASRQSLTYEANVVSGDIPGKAKEQRQKELDSVVEENIPATSMNVTPSGKVTGKNCSVNRMIENPSNQGELVCVEITLDSTGEKIFGTGAIRPGNYLESGPLMVSLPAGEYSCTAVFLAYQEKSENLIGQAAVRIKLVLQE